MRTWSILSGVTNSLGSSGSSRLRVSAAFLRLRLHALHGGLRGIERVALAFDAPLGDLDLAVECGQLGARAFDRELVRARIDDEQELALLHRLVVHDVQLDDRAAHLRHDADGVGHHDRVVRLRVPHDPPDDHDRENDRADHDPEDDDSSEETARAAHVSSRTRPARSRRMRRQPRHG